MSYYDYGYPEYVSVAEKKAKAAKKLAQLKKKNPTIKPVVITGRTLATTWWGKSWNSNLERYADYSNRIGRGRSYVRHGSVLDLQLSSGKITAQVQGSRGSPYDVVIKIKKLSSGNWDAIRKSCEGSFDSLSELLSGKFPKSLKDLFFEKKSGLFPTPKEIEFDCSCPDWASMCKHVAAALYGVGARFDEDPSLFFTLRGINIDDMITRTVADTAKNLLNKAKNQSKKVLEDIDVGDVFGIQMDDIGVPAPKLPPAASKIPASANNKKGTMLSALSKAIGKARKGKTFEQLQDKLGWSKTQLRNTISRAAAKDLIEVVKPGIYRNRL